jgi:hypothetical protein
MDEATLYLIISIYTIVSITHMLYFISKEMTTILDINVLTLTKKQLEA